LTEEEMFKTLETRIHQFAKRQDTWFRRMERKGVDIHWINGHDYEEMKEYIHTLL
jgi:tRNA dimethylallyltransferase